MAPERVRLLIYSKSFIQYTNRLTRIKRISTVARVEAKGKHQTFTPSNYFTLEAFISSELPWKRVHSAHNQPALRVNWRRRTRHTPTCPTGGGGAATAVVFDRADLNNKIRGFFAKSHHSNDNRVQQTRGKGSRVYIPTIS